MKIKGKALELNNIDRERRPFHNNKKKQVEKLTSIKP